MGLEETGRKLLVCQISVPYPSAIIYGSAREIGRVETKLSSDRLSAGKSISEHGERIVASVSPFESV